MNMYSNNSNNCIQDPMGNFFEDVLMYEDAIAFCEYDLACAEEQKKKQRRRMQRIQTVKKKRRQFRRLNYGTRRNPYAHSTKIAEKDGKNKAAYIQRISNNTENTFEKHMTNLLTRKTDDLPPKGNHYRKLYCAD